MDSLKELKNSVILDGAELVQREHLPVPPNLRILIFAPQNPQKVYTILVQDYLPQHLILLDGQEKKLEDLCDGWEQPPQVLEISPRTENRSFEYFQNVVATLRGENGCPWDKEQTHQSLRDDFLQEVYELLDGLDLNDPQMIQEELGDVLLHLVLQAHIAMQSGEFCFGDVVEEITAKLIFRHPHVFSSGEELSSDEVIGRWERLKRIEKEKKEKTHGLLDGVSKAMPALSMAFAYQKRAARVGFDWRDEQGVWDKLTEEIDEFKAAQSVDEAENELGDILFTIVNLARWRKIVPETALRVANQKFFDRVHYVEKRAAEIGKNLFDMPIEEKDIYWDEYKSQREE